MAKTLDIVKTHPRTKTEGVIIASAMVVFTVWGFRSLYEYGKPSTKPTTHAGDIKELVGLSNKPAPPSRFMVGFGFTFFTLSVGGLIIPNMAEAFAVLIAVGSTLANGASLFTDIAEGTANATVEPETTHKVTHKNSPHGENQTPRSHT